MALNVFSELLDELPEELLESLPKLEDGKTAVFRTLKTRQDFHPITGEWSTLYPSLSVGFKDVIKYKGNRYRIGIPKEIRNEQIVSYKNRVFGIREVFDGKIIFKGGNFEDEEMYLFFLLSNKNKNNPFRDKNVEPEWELVDNVAETKIERKYRNQKAEALMVATQLSLREVREFVLSLNEDEFQDEDTLRNIVEKYAEVDPVAFLQNYSNPSFKLRAIIKRAADRGFIVYDAATKKVKRTDAKNTTLAVLDEDKDWLASFSEYCISSSNGENIMKELRKKLKDAVVSEVPAADEEQ